MKALVFALALAACGAPPSDDPLPLGRSAQECGGCHESHYDQWRLSPHAGAASSPVLEAMLPEVEEVWGTFARETCEGCHAPEHGPDEGIGCLSCHAATGNHAERDGMLAVDPSRPFAGPLADATPTVAHDSRPGDFLASPSLCGTCHEITAPELVQEPTLTEYRASPQAAEGRTCADCHMPDEAPASISNDVDVVRTPSSHRFVGFDPPWGAPAEEAAAAAERTRTLLAEALALEVERDGDAAIVRVTNVGAAHNVPTGAAFLRDLWVDVTVDGVLHERAITIGDQPMAGETPVPLLTRADHVELGSLAPNQSATATFEGTDVHAVLRGRAVRPAVLDAIGRPDLASELPVHVVHEVEAP